jgi:hypothetical protein
MNCGGDLFAASFSQFDPQQTSLVQLSSSACDPKPTFMAEPALFNPHAAADLAGEGFERLRVMLGRSNQAFPGPLCVGAGRS